MHLFFYVPLLFGHIMIFTVIYLGRWPSEICQQSKICLKLQKFDNSGFMSFFPPCNLVFLCSPLGGRHIISLGQPGMKVYNPHICFAFGLLHSPICSRTQWNQQLQMQNIKMLKGGGRDQTANSALLTAAIYYLSISQVLYIHHFTF